jgi:hypothetical protein
MAFLVTVWSVSCFSRLTLVVYPPNTEQEKQTVRDILHQVAQYYKIEHDRGARALSSAGSGL